MNDSDYGYGGGGGGEPLEDNYYFIDDEGNKVGVNVDELEDLENGEEFLLYYARNGELPMVRKLLSSRDEGAIELNIDCKGKKKNNHGWTSLHLACYFGHYEVVKILLEHRASVNVMNDAGDTPLHKASYVGRLDIVTLLLSHDADVFIKNGEGKTPKDICQDSEILEALLAAECNDMKRKEAQFLRAARDGDISTVKELLNDLNPVNVNCKDLAGNTALHWASYRNHKEIVVFLLQNGTDPNIRNNSDRVASSLASSVHIKQLLLNVQPVTFNMNIKTLAKCMINRFEGPLARRGKFLVRRNVWAVLERGVLSFFSNLADASTGVKRRGYKYLESAVIKHNPKDENSFTIFFPDNTRTVLAVPPVAGQSSISNSSLDRQKWINAITDHIDYATKFLKDGVRIDNDEEDELREILSAQSLQPHINSAQAHLGILQKHIKALMQLVEEDMAFLRMDSDKAENEPTPSKGFGSYFYGNSSSGASGGGGGSTLSSKELCQEWKNYWPTLKFHLNILMESGNHTSASLSDCIMLLSKQDQLRQLFAKRDQEKIRVLEESLRVLAKKHHEFEHSLIQSTAPRGSRLTFSETDADEYFDAFGDGDDLSVNDQQFNETTTSTSSDTNAEDGMIKISGNGPTSNTLDNDDSIEQMKRPEITDPIKAFNEYLAAANTTIDDILTETLSNSLDQSLTISPSVHQSTEPVPSSSSSSSTSSKVKPPSTRPSSTSLSRLQNDENPRQ